MSMYVYFQEQSVYIHIFKVCLFYKYVLLKLLYHNQCVVLTVFRVYKETHTHSHTHTNTNVRQVAPHHTYTCSESTQT
jgi:hypothetical protein